MNEMYKSTVKAVNTYMYPKQYVTLNVSVVSDTPESESVVEESEPAAIELDAPVVTEAPPAEPVMEEHAPAVVELDATEVLEEINPKEMKKSELISFVQTVHGEDADVSGTKAEIIERYFS